MQVTIGGEKEDSRGEFELDMESRRGIGIILINVESRRKVEGSFNVMWRAKKGWGEF
jgi:hypothetical protein